MTDRPTIEQLHNLVDRAQHGLTASEVARLREGITDLETTARVFAALHHGAEETVTRVIGLYEQWVKSGPPPLGASMARWWDARLVELHGAIRPAAAASCSPAAPETEPNNSRTTAKNPADA